MASKASPTKSQVKNEANGHEVSINVSLPAELHRRLRIRSVTDGVTLKEVVAAALTQYLRK